MSLGDVGLVLLSAFPIRGFGILSASIVSFFLKKGKIKGTLLLMVGSCLGILIIMGIANGVFKIWGVLFNCRFEIGDCRLII